MLSPSAPSRTQHSLLYLPSRRQAWTQQAWTWLRQAHGTWCDHEEAVLQPLSQHHASHPSCSSACLPPPPRRTEAASGSHVLPCLRPAPASAALCPPLARRVLALPAIITPPPATSSVHALLHLPPASHARNGRGMVLSRQPGAASPTLWPRACAVDSILLQGGRGLTYPPLVFAPFFMHCRSTPGSPVPTSTHPPTRRGTVPEF